MLGLFLLPGTITHELSHALFCLVTGATIKELSITKINNPGIKYERPSVPVVGDFLIVFAPIAGCVLALSIVYLVLNTWIDAEVPLDADIQWRMVKFFYGLKNVVLYTVYKFWVHRDYGNAKVICSLIATVIFSISITPRRGDIKYLFPGIAIIAGAFSSLDAIGLTLTRLEWLDYSINRLWGFTTAGLCAVAGFLCITIVIIALTKGMKLVFGRR